MGGGKLAGVGRAGEDSGQSHFNISPHERSDGEDDPH
jgi:hypothetical protein